mmetsp:Transcript_15067/g.19546  ORF Transcript_15067/g.19546 Transcript_15067/m.19546 type:complete len:259 (-) Transcript_15067:7-783(-)
MNKIGWKGMKPGEKAPNMHTIKTQTVFIRPEQYKDCMDLSLMLAWNAQCTSGPPEKRVSQTEAYKVDKFRGNGQGTGDALWKNEAKSRLKHQFAEQAKDARISHLEQQIAEAKHVPYNSINQKSLQTIPSTPKNYGFRNTLVEKDPPIAAMLPQRQGSPGTRGVKQQFLQHDRQHRRLQQSMGLEPSPPRLNKKGIPQGFHDPPGQTISNSHKAMSRQKNQHHHEKPKMQPFDSTKSFQPNWKPTVQQSRTHSIRDLA